MALKTTNTYPPAGFLYTEPSTGYRPNPMQSFNSVVADLVRHRKGNNLPRATFAEASEDIQNATCLRLGNDPNWCTGQKKTSTSGSLSASPLHQRNLVPHAEEKSKSAKLSVGARILNDWLGDGLKPVTPELAQARADVCTGRISGHPCPYNQPSSGIIGMVTSTVAGKIKEQMESKNAMSVTVAGEDKLKTCAICWCHLPLKVHTPMSTIVDRTPDAMFSEFQRKQPACWMVTEIN